MRTQRAKGWWMVDVYRNLLAMSAAIDVVVASRGEESLGFERRDDGVVEWRRAERLMARTYPSEDGESRLDTDDLPVGFVACVQQNRALSRK